MGACMKVAIKEEDKNISTIEVESDPGRALKAYQMTLKKLGENLNLPGFRKGKIPSKMVEDHYGADYIKGQALNLNLVSEILFEAFAQEKLEVLFIPAVEDVQLDKPEAEVKIKAKIELFPEVKLGNYKDTKIEVEIHEFKEEEYLQDTLNRIKSQFADYEESEGPIAMKDEIVLDFSGRVKADEGADEEYFTLPELKAEQYQVIVEPGRFIEGFLEQMVGMKVGEEKTLDVKFPDDYGFDKVKGREAKFDVKVHKISHPKEPELNDELAQKLGMESFEKLKERVLDEMKRSNEHQKKTAAAEAVLSKMLEISEIDISEQVVERELQTSLARIQEQNRWDQKQLEEFKATLDMDKEKELAEKNLRKSFIISKIIKDQEITVSDEEMDTAVQQAMADPYNNFQNMDIKNLKHSIRSQLISDKAVQFLVDAFSLDYKACDHEHHHH